MEHRNKPPESEIVLSTSEIEDEIYGDDYDKAYYKGGYKALKRQKQGLEKSFETGKLSEEAYKSKVRELDKKLNDYRIESQLKRNGFLTAKVRNEHLVIDLNCPCGWRGTVTYGKLDAILLGKDRKGFIYFGCPLCKEHLQYDPLTGNTKTRKGILGFLFGRFS